MKTENHAIEQAIGWTKKSKEKLKITQRKMKIQHTKSTGYTKVVLRGKSLAIQEHLEKQEKSWAI